MKKTFILVAVLVFLFSCGNKQLNKTEEDLEKITENKILILSEDSEKVVFKDEKGNIVIENKEYLMSFTDTFYTMAIVLSEKEGFIGIDRDQNTLFNIFNYDNGPDYISEGLFRIIEEGKIGYANLTGEIVIKPQFSCAYPFEEGKAKVAKNCNISKLDEHETWESEEWFFIDKKGNTVK